MPLYLVDSSIFIYRAWFAPQPGQINRDSQPNQAFIGFTDFVYRLLTERAPANLVFAFDESRQQGQRKSIYPAYKANRQTTPADLQRQFSWCQQWIEALGISKVSSAIWEADDLIGTLATMHRGNDMSIVILSADKDLTQLIREGDLWWSFYDDKKLDYRGVKKKFGVNPEQIADQLALAGDKVDNIPGIPGLGMKVAANLLRKYGDIDNLRQNLHKVKNMKFRYAGKFQRLLVEHESVLDISTQLTRINCEIEEMDRVEIKRDQADLKTCQQMMLFHNMDKHRSQRWNDYFSIKATAQAVV